MKLPTIPDINELIRLHELEIRRSITEEQGSFILELLLAGFAGAKIEVLS